MIRTPTQETSREVAKSSENISSKVTRADKNQNWRNRNRVRFNDVGFDEGAIPENPFMNIRDVSELPIKGTTTDKRYVEEIQETEVQNDTQNQHPLYNFRAPVQKSGKVNELVDKILENELLVKAIDLLSVSKPIREELKFRVTQQRVAPGKQPKPTQVRSQFEEVEAQNNIIDVQSLPNVTWDKTLRTEIANNGEKLSAFVIGDVVVQYLETLSPEETPKQIVVAKDSTSLRSVYPLINARLHVESLVDSGSQIVSISQNIAEKAGLIWDPDMVIYSGSKNCPHVWYFWKDFVFLAQLFHLAKCVRWQK